jgi:hypothetical protein
MKKIFTILFTLSTLIGLAQRPFSSISIVLNDSSELHLKPDFYLGEEKNIVRNADGLINSINGREVFGVGYHIPKLFLSKATLHIGDKKFELNTEQIFNPWELDLKSNETTNHPRAFLINNNSQKRIYLLISNNESTFIIKWTINENDIISREIVKWEDWNYELLFK